MARPWVQRALSPASDREFEAILTRDGVSRRVLEQELNALYLDGLRFHPYRWYAPAGNYRGAYFTTDAYGFRIDPRTVRAQTSKIAFFGGSAMFSVRSRDEATIPALISQALDERVAQALNFGIGGYSSTAEFTIFIEALREYDHITCAVFYDGYNEIARYVERLQDHADEPYYGVIGYPLYGILRPALDSLIDAHESTIRYTPQTIRLFEGVVSRLRGARNINVLVNDHDISHHAEAIAGVYLRNVRDIAAIAEQHQVTPVFVWQPDIASTTSKPFTTEEARLKETDPVVRKLSAAVRSVLLHTPEVSAYRWVDLSQVLDELDARPHFLDPVHVSVDANRLIATKLAGILRDVTPSAHWK